jgi:hypothetical protein
MRNFRRNIFSSEIESGGVSGISFKTEDNLTQLIATENQEQYAN